MDTQTGLDFVMLSQFSSVRDGLSAMLTEHIGHHGYELGYVDVPIALFVIEAAKRAEDRKEWFPHGKWATIQSMQAEVDKELARVFGERPDYTRESHSRW